MDLPGCRISYPGFGYQGEAERRRSGQERLLAVLRTGGYRNNCTLRGNNPGQDDDRHEYWRIDEWQAASTDAGYSPAEHGHERSVTLPRASWPDRGEVIFLARFFHLRYWVRARPTESTMRAWPSPRLYTAPTTASWPLATRSAISRERSMSRRSVCRTCSASISSAVDIPA